MLTAAASVAWRILDVHVKHSYEQKAATEKELYKLAKITK
jgi:hypothetical protein